jgi:chromosome segregation ATPase
MTSLALQLVCNDVFVATTLGALLAYVPFIPAKHTFNSAHFANATGRASEVILPDLANIPVLMTPSLPEQIVTTVTDTVTQIETTIYTKSVSYVTQTSFHGQERTVTEYLTEPTVAIALPTSTSLPTVTPLPTVAAQDAPSYNTYNGFIPSVDSLLFFVIVATFICYCLRGLLRLQEHIPATDVHSDTSPQVSKSTEGLRRRRQKMKSEVLRLRKASQLRKSDHVRMQQKLDAATTEIAHHTSTTASATTSEATIKDLERRLAQTGHLQAEHKELENELKRALKAEEDMAKSYNSGWMAERQTLISENDAATAKLLGDVEKLKKALEVTGESDQTAHNDEILALRSEIDRLKNEHQTSYQSYTQSLNEHQATIEQLQELGRQNLQGEAQQLSDQYAVQVSGLQAEIARFEHDAACGNAKIEQLQASNAELETMNTAMKEAGQELQNKLQQQDAEIQQLDSVIQLRDDKIESEKQELWSLKNQRDTAKTDLEKLQGQLQSHIQAIQEEMEQKAQADIAAREARITALNAQVNALNAQIKGMMASREHIEKSERAHYEASKKAKAEIEPLRKQVADLQRRLRVKDSEIEKLEDRLTQKMMDEELFGEDLAYLDK